jgi:lipopolysaccharide/colanic/teichoic acid biosynthesis glycosyltransferase
MDYVLRLLEAIDFQQIFKIALDLLLASLLLIVFLLPSILIAILIKLTSHGPVFFTQLRLGRNNQPFKIYKFRTMGSDAETLLESNPRLKKQYIKNFKINDDPRITYIGKWLRKLSIDELPQIINVFKGEMSMVGPRPIVPNEIAKYGDFGQRLLTVKPGVTGLWQAKARFKHINYEQRIQLDMEYIDKMSFWYDIKIILMTSIAVICCNGK